MIDFSGGHTTVIGITRSGKTYATKCSLAAQPRGVLFFNTQHEEMPGYTQADRTNSYSQIIRKLHAGGKINYLPHTDPAVAQQELQYVIQALYGDYGDVRDGHDIILAVDEIHLYEGKALKQCIRLATTGLRFGIRAVWISQRPANIDNTLMTQSNQFIIFDTNMEATYFKAYGIPQEDIQQRLQQGGQYSYCTYNFKTIEGPAKV